MIPVVDKTAHCLEISEPILKLSLICVFLISFVLCRFLMKETSDDPNRKNSSKKTVLNDSSEKELQKVQSNNMVFDESTVSFFSYN